MKISLTGNTAAGSLQEEMVHFEFTHPTASVLGVAGTFNKWRPHITPMMQWGDGRWMAEVFLVPGVYEYCLVVDGAWMADPLVKESVPNRFGGRNSVLRVIGSSEGLLSNRRPSPVAAKR